MEKELVVFDLAFAQELCRRGYLMSYCEPNRNEPDRLVFKFKIVPGIWEDFNELKERYRLYGQIWDWELSIWIDGI